MPILIAIEYVISIQVIYLSLYPIYFDNDGKMAFNTIQVTITSFIKWYYLLISNFHFS